MSIMKNAIIESVSLKIERGFVLSSYVHINDGDFNQGFGGYGLYLTASAKYHDKKSYAGHWIGRVLQMAGVDDWEELKGRSIRIKREDESFNAKIIAIGHIIKDEWFCPQEEFNDENNT